MELNKLYCIDNISGMKQIQDNSINLTVTSPPYDKLRNYNGYSFDFENVAKQLFRVTKDGGVIVWIVGDATINGSETLSSFKQAIYFQSLGFNIHNTMIWDKGTFTAVGALVNRYAPVFEYMFIISKGYPKTFNSIKDRENKSFGRKKHGTFRQKDGTTKPLFNIGKNILEFGQRFNIWQIPAEKSNSKRLHPAMFPENLIKDHIISWSNENDIIFDPFVGSGTTCKAAKDLNRRYLGFDISQEYIDIANLRISNE